MITSSSKRQGDATPADAARRRLYASRVLAACTPSEGGWAMVAVSVYLLVFRVVHIGAAVAWAGSVFFLVTYVQPSAAAIAPAGAPFMAELLGARKLIDRIIGMGSVAVLGGLFLYWHDVQVFGGFGDWISSSFGTTLTIGAIASIVALIAGVLATRPSVMRLLALGRRAAEAGGPSPEMTKEIGRIQQRLKLLGRTQLTLLAVAVLAMATARYW
jgi:uncharacterized membrane protein